MRRRANPSPLHSGGDARGSFLIAHNACRRGPRFDPPPPSHRRVAGTPCQLVDPTLTKASDTPMTATFAGLGLHADLVAALARQGITEPFPIQELTIADALAGRDVLRQGQDRLGQDPGLRAAAARTHRPGRTAPPARPRARADARAGERRSPTCSRPLGDVRDRKVRAVYGGVSMDPQVGGAPERASTSSSAPPVV